MYQSLIKRIDFSQLEEKVNLLLIENDRTKKHLGESEEEIERLKMEEVRVCICSHIFLPANKDISWDKNSFLFIVCNSKLGVSEAVHIEAKNILPSSN